MKHRHIYDLFSPVGYNKRCNIFTSIVQSAFLHHFRIKKAFFFDAIVSEKFPFHSRALNQKLLIDLDATTCS